MCAAGIRGPKISARKRQRGIADVVGAPAKISVAHPGREDAHRGALIGADLSNLHRVGELSAPVVSIGGAGTFDGVFLTGLIAGLLA